MSAKAMGKSIPVAAFSEMGHISLMAYELITSERSPFGRICRVFMIAHGIDFQMRIVNFVEKKEDAAALAKETPINKVPVLVLEDGRKIFDSRVIFNYLSQKHGVPALRLEEENFLSAVYSCMDVSVILFLMKRNGYDLSAENFFLSRQKQRLPSNLEYVRAWAQDLDPANPQDWNFASMSLYVFLQWADARAQTIQLKDYPELAAFVERFANAPGVRETFAPLTPY